MEPSVQRKNEFIAWFSQVAPKGPIDQIAPLPGDASFRQYYRMYASKHTWIGMDASVEKQVCVPFVAIAKALRAMGLMTPEILAEDSTRGYLLLTDFGDAPYLKVLNQNNADYLYEIALRALSVLSACRHVEGYTVPPFTTAFMQQEWAWHKEWFLQKWLGLSLGTLEKVLDQTYALIAESASLQPQVFMHRDYHSNNLMWLPNEDVGILDFQDAFIGPLTYDLVSLLRDCYVAWPTESVVEWALLYWQMLQGTDLLEGVSEQTFLQWFDWMGVQRHLKALLTFSRKSVRDQDHRYLSYVPRALNYILAESEPYPALSILHDYYESVVFPAVLKKGISCEQ